MKALKRPVVKRKKHGVRVFKVKVWGTPYADSKFSLWIRARDGKCRRCLSADKPLDNSHYWRRDMKGTRFSPENCVALCRDCHTIWERQQNQEYKDFMIAWLGTQKYEDLEKRARGMMKMRDAVLELQRWISPTSLSTQVIE